MNEFFRALEALDLVLARAVKAGTPPDAADASAKQAAALAALDALLATVPADVLAASKELLAGLRAKAAEAAAADAAERVAAMAAGGGGRYADDDGDDDALRGLLVK